MFSPTVKGGRLAQTLEHVRMVDDLEQLALGGGQDRLPRLGVQSVRILPDLNGQKDQRNDDCNGTGQLGQCENLFEFHEMPLRL